MTFTDRFTAYKFDNFGYIRLPSIEITKEERASIGFAEEMPNEDFLKELLNIGLSKLLKNGYIPKDREKEYINRAKQEYETFVELGFVDYVLLVWRVCNFCTQNDIMRDYGRGSCAGSLSFFCMGITQIDPMKYGLFFERFISKTRAKKKVVDGVTYIDGSLAPDVDLDVDPHKRHKVVEFLQGLYPNRMCKILNMSELSGKILIKECGKVVEEIPEHEMIKVADMIPKHFGIVHDLEDAYKDEPEFHKWCDENKDVYNIALQLRHLYKNSSVHASGYVVSYNKLLDVMPLQLTSKDKEIVSSYTMNDVSSLSIKLDILGSRCSAVVDDCCKQLGIDWRSINVDSDSTIYDNLKMGLRHPHGIFQLEADCNLRVVNEVKPKNLQELSDVVAMARPGALAYVEKYVKNEDEKVHPIFDKILEKTRYVCLYQEDMMRMAHAIGFTLEEAEILRRIVGKKKVDEVKEWKAKIYAKCKENNHPESLGDLLWKILDDSSKYSFNLSHSVSFAALAALTLYLKYKHPLEFYIALLNQAKHEMNPLQEINTIQNELHDFGIKLLPPDLTKSDMNFVIEGNNIRYGLGSLKGVSDKTIEKLLGFRKAYANRFEAFEAAEQCKINIGVLSSLIQSGCLGAGIDRSSLVYEAQLYRLLTVAEKKYVHAIYKSMSDKLSDLRDILHYMIKNKNDKGKPYIKESRVETLKRRSAPYKAIFKQNSENEKLAIYYYEKQNVGYSYTYNLRELNLEFKNMLDTVNDVKNNKDINDRIFTVCEVIECFKKTSKKGSFYLKMTVQDETGTIDCLAFNNQRVATVDLIEEENGGVIPESGDIVFIKGKKSEDAVYLDRCDIQNFKIYTKLSELKNDFKEEELVEKQ